MRGIYILGLALPRSPTYVTALIRRTSAIRIWIIKGIYLLRNTNISRNIVKPCKPSTNSYSPVVLFTSISNPSILSLNHSTSSSLFLKAILVTSRPLITPCIFISCRFSNAASSSCVERAMTTPLFSRRVMASCARFAPPAGWLCEGDDCIMDVVVEVVRGFVYLVGVGVWQISKDCD